jgi:hypothetical protein
VLTITEVKAKLGAGAPFYTELLPSEVYYPAEEYHQQYLWDKGGMYAIYVSSYYYIFVFIPLYVCPHSTVCMRGSTSSNTCGTEEVYVCPHTAVYVS